VLNKYFKSVFIFEKASDKEVGMKIIAIGIGQCGCNIADEFYAVNNYAKSFSNRRIEILIDAFAINTDETDLAGLRHIPQDKRHRIVMGAMRTFGHGVGKINLDAAKIMKEIPSVVADNVFNCRKFDESDGVVVIGSGGGGTGSGAIGWLVKGLKERVDKSVYAIVVLPFAYEEKGGTSYATTNTATCLKMVTKYADAVFLLDNEKFGRADISMSANFRRINREMVMNFYDLFCAGEERKQKYVGSKVVDAGDIKQSLEGISTIGRGAFELSAFYPWKNGHYREAAKEKIGAAGALSKAVNNLCLSVNMEDARKILRLTSTRSSVPEALRVAHLIASGITSV
jgi:cell division GTPase FtsZ